MPRKRKGGHKGGHRGSNQLPGHGVELEKFSQSDLRTWQRHAENLDRYYVQLFYHLARHHFAARHRLIKGWPTGCVGASSARDAMMETVPGSSSASRALLAPTGAATMVAGSRAVRAPTGAATMVAGSRALLAPTGAATMVARGARSYRCCDDGRRVARGARSYRSFFSRPAVEGLRVAAMFCARRLPSSTPHWSKELMP